MVTSRPLWLDVPVAFGRDGDVAREVPSVALLLPGVRYRVASRSAAGSPSWRPAPDQALPPRSVETSVRSAVPSGLALGVGVGVEPGLLALGRSRITIRESTRPTASSRR